MDEYKLGDVDLNGDKIDPIYKKGFEHGYWLQRGDSKDLDSVIEGSKNHPPYHKGLRAGRKEAEREVIRQRMQGNSDQSQSREREIDIE